MPAVALTTTRDQILDAVDALMARYGFRKMTMDDVAREAGISKRTIYLYFSSKEEVGLSSIARAVERVHSNLRAIVARNAPVQDRLRDVLIERVMGRTQAVKDYHQSLDELFEVVRPAYLARRDAYFQEEVALLQQLLDEGKAAGAFQFQDSEEVAKAMLLATNSFLPYSLTVRELGNLKQIRADLEIMAGLLIRGVAAPNH
jgi:AcrR family transcriptional regulator